MSFQFAEESTGPHVRAMDDEQQLAPGLLDRIFALGVMAIEIPEEFDGAAGSFFDAVLAIEAISTVDPAVAVLVDVHNTLVVNALRRWGTPAQQQQWFPRLASDTVGAYALSEAGAGSDAFALQTRATPAEGGYRLDGRKLWISNAREAGLFIVFATLDPAAGYRGITAFLVEKGAPGLSVGRKEDKLGIRASSTCELILDGCFVPAANLLGEPGKGYKIAIETLNEGRIGIGAQMLGLAEGACAGLIFPYLNEETLAWWVGGPLGLRIAPFYEAPLEESDERFRLPKSSATDIIALYNRDMRVDPKRLRNTLWCADARNKW